MVEIEDVDFGIDGGPQVIRLEEITDVGVVAEDVADDGGSRTSAADEEGGGDGVVARGFGFDAVFGAAVERSVFDRPSEGF